MGVKYKKKILFGFTEKSYFQGEFTKKKKKQYIDRSP